MPNLGPLELLVIFVVALVVFGPNKLPEIGRQVGRAVREFRRIQSSFRTELNDILEDPPPGPPGYDPRGTSSSPTSETDEAALSPTPEAEAGEGALAPSPAAETGEGALPLTSAAESGEAAPAPADGGAIAADSARARPAQAPEPTPPLTPGRAGKSEAAPGGPPPASTSGAPDQSLR